MFLTVSNLNYDDHMRIGDPQFFPVFGQLIDHIPSTAAILETRLPVILAGRVVELRCNGWRVVLLKPHKRRANPSQNVPLKDGEEMRGYYQMAASS